MKRIAAALLVLMMILILTACGGNKNGAQDEPDGIVGSYALNSATIEGTDYTYEELDSYGMADGTFIKFSADGTGEFGLSGEEPESFTYDKATGGITFDSDDTTAIFTVEGGKVTLDYEAAGMTMVFVPDDAADSLSSAGSSAGANAGAGDFFNDITVAATMDDAFAGAGAGCLPPCRARSALVPPQYAAPGDGTWAQTAAQVPITAKMPGAFPAADPKISPP